MTPATTALIAAPAALTSSLAGVGLVVQLVLCRRDGRPLEAGDVAAARSTLAHLETAARS